MFTEPSKTSSAVLNNTHYNACIRGKRQPVTRETDLSLLHDALEDYKNVDYFTTFVVS